MGSSGSVADRPEPPGMRWWGWGDPAHVNALPAHALGFLRETVGLGETPRPPVALGRVALPEPEVPDALLDQLRQIVGTPNVREDRSERVRHAAGKSYPDLVRMRAGEPEGAPDVVVHPSDHAQVQALLELCARASLAVVPFGGGTSVVGGVAPLRAQHRAVLCLDLGRMGALLELDGESSTVTVQGGIRAPALEAQLETRGLTLGHFPQSFEYVSLGGCAATRSAGQASTGYGAIEKLVLGLRFAAPSTDISLAAMPASAAGPGLRQLLVGSEGTLGVISELSLRVRRAPRERIYEGIFFEALDSGMRALRALAREHALPDIARLSDQAETRMSMALAGSGGPKGRAGRAYLSLRGYRDGCLAIFGFEGSAEEVACRRRRALELTRAHGGLPVGRSPGRAWLASRFAAPYLRDELITHGLLVETLETATQWSSLGSLQRAVARAIDDALEDCGTPGLVMSHVSHIYETGASLYFTFIARQHKDDPLGQWRRVKDAASRAILAGGGTITHHHAVGRDHAGWMTEEVGGGGLAVLAAVKEELDPNAIMNPGKLLPLSRRG
jgi:alkyldihydroxyacetonephosphate synthase